MTPTIIRAPNSDAPKEFEQFAFLAGDWDCDIRQLTASGDYMEAKARWVGTYTLDGYAFQDDMLTPFGQGLGTTWRTYDVQKKSWACLWLEAGRDVPAQFTHEWFYGGLVGDEMHLRGPGRDDKGAYENHIVFSDISDTRISWSLARSYDGGKSWMKDVGNLEAKRRA
jgi:hypothetical protein